MDIAQILTLKFPVSEWSIIGNDYANLVWISDDPKPTENELKNLWPHVQYELACQQVERKRQAEYKQSADGLFFGWQRGENTEQEWLDAVRAVKDANPYPTV